MGEKREQGLRGKPYTRRTVKRRTRKKRNREGFERCAFLFSKIIPKIMFINTSFLIPYSVPIGVLFFSHCGNKNPEYPL